MNYYDARRKSRILMLFGSIAIISGGLVCFVAILKLFYYRIDTGSELSRAIAAPLKDIVVELVYFIRLPDQLWGLAPTPNPSIVLTVENYIFVSYYIILIVGLVAFGAGLRLKRRLDRIDQEIDDQLIKDSIEGKCKRSKSDIQKSLEVARFSILSGLHKYYFAPLIALVVGTVLLKWVGVV